MTSSSPKLFCIEDWSRLDTQDAAIFKRTLPLSTRSSQETYGMHLYNGEVWSGPFIGLFSLIDKDPSGKRRRHSICIRPRFAVDPWMMLEKVLQDNESEDYLNSLASQQFPLFKVFSDSPLIEVPTEVATDGAMLASLSFIESCFAVCKKGLKKSMCKNGLNLTSKIRGRVNIRKNLRVNSSKGRNDRFFCDISSFTVDTIENQILLAALNYAHRYLRDYGLCTKTIARRIQFCRTAFHGISSRTPAKRDRQKLNFSGFYSYYNPALSIANLLLSESFRSPASAPIDQNEICYSAPYLINMQLLFELYCRATLKQVLPDSMVLVEYGAKLQIWESAPNQDNRTLHLMKNLMPDIIIRSKSSGETIVVLDAKYKDSERADRSDTLQLLAYAFKCAPKSCGIVFPLKSCSNIPETSGTRLLSPYISPGLPYFEYFIDTNDVNSSFGGLV